MILDQDYLKLEYIVLALAGFFGFLGVIDTLDIEYQMIIDVRWTKSEFILGFNPIIILLLIILCLIPFFIRKKHRTGLFVSIIPLILFRGQLGLALCCLVLVVVYLYYEKGFEVYIFWVLFWVSLFELLVAVHWVLLNPLGVEIFTWIAFVDTQLYYVGAHLSPFLVPLVVFYSIIIFLQKYKNGFPEFKVIEKEDKQKTRTLILLGLICVSAITEARYPYNDNINPSNRNFGLDLSDYITNLEDIQGDPFAVFSVKEGSRPLIYLLLTGLQYVTGLGAVSTVRLVTIILNPAIGLATFYMAHQFFRDQDIAIASSFFAVLGFPVVIGLTGGFLANMLSFVFLGFSLGALFAALRKKSPRYLVASIILGVLVLFTHPWTFDQYTGVALLLTITGLTVYRGEFLTKFQSKYVAGYTFSLILAELLRSYIFTGIGGISALGEFTGGFVNIFSFWDAIILSSWFVYGGLFANIVIIVLVLYGLLKLNKPDLPSYYLSLFMFSSSVFWLIGDAVIKDRLFYNMPLWLLSGYGLITMYRNTSQSMGKILIIFVVLFQITYTFRGLAIL